MVKNRKEPTLSDSKNSLGPDLMVPVDYARTNRRVVLSKMQQTSGKKPSSTPYWFAILISISALLLASHSVWQAYQFEQQSTVMQDRIDELETKLTLSGDESSQSLLGLTSNVKEMKKNVDLLLEEVDKLWATRNVNRKAIADLDNALQTQKEQFTVFKRDLNKEVDIVKNSFKKNSDSIASAQSSLEAVNKTLNSLELKTQEQDLLVQSLREKNSSFAGQLNALKSDVANAVDKKALRSIETKLNVHSEAIESIDKFRVTTNRELLNLRQRSSQ